MATTAQRRLQTKEVRRFGSLRPPHITPDLTQIQTASFAEFLQFEVPWQERQDKGIEGVLREIFPIESYDKSLRLEYVRYELGKPRYEPDECRQLRLTYGRPFKVWLRLTKEQPVEEEVYLGDVPIMIGGGEFIINGAERVVVSQLHRSPGVDFVVDTQSSERRLHSCRIIPERGSWIELNVTRKESLTVRIDQSGKFSAMTLLRAMDPKYGQDSALLKTFYETHVEKITSGRSAAKIEGKLAVEDIIYPSDSERAGEIIVECAQKISKGAAETICTSGLKQVAVMDDQKNVLLLNALADDTMASHEEALLRIYQRLPPGRHSGERDNIANEPQNDHPNNRAGDPPLATAQARTTQHDSHDGCQRHVITDAGMSAAGAEGQRESRERGRNAGDHIGAEADQGHRHTGGVSSFRLPANCKKIASVSHPPQTSPCQHQ